MRIHLVHHYVSGKCSCGYDPVALVHDHTDAFLTLPEAQRHAAEHGADVDTVAVADLFTATDLETIITAVTAIQNLAQYGPGHPMHARLRDVRTKAAALAFGQVAGL